MNQPTAPTSPPASAGAQRILVVDDEQIACTFCALALRTAGYDVTAVTEAELAVAALREQGPFDLLLADIQMPGMSGLELAQVARDGDPAVAIIIMTGHTTLDTMRQSVQRGIADFLSKPFELEELRLAVDRALHKRQLLQESIRLRALEQLLHSSEAINAILDRDELCRVILERARSHAPCAAAFLLLFEAGQPAGPTPYTLDQFQLGEAGLAAARQAFQETRPVGLEPGEPLCADPAGATIAGGLAVPLRAQGEAVGVLLLCDEGAELRRPPTVDLMALLANQAGTALRNAQLYSEVRRAYRELAELDRLKSEFIAIASHELRSPLAIVLGYTKMVRDRSEGDQREYAQRALSSADQIRQIIDDMLRLRDFDLNRAELLLEECPLDELVRHVAARLQPDAAAKGQQLLVSLPEPPITMRADRDKALLVLGALVANAIKFTASGGQIRLLAERWGHERLAEAAQAAAPNPTLRRLGESAPPAWAVVRVADTGIGIPPEQHARIFERFYQVASSLTRNHGGTGLGLALVSDLARIQGGVVWVESRPGAGSTFSFALPVG